MQIEMTPEKRAELDRVNTEVNKRVKPVTDQVQYGKPEYWEVADKAGDCEDYALAKWKELIALDWPREACDIVICKVLRTGEYHAVLVAHGIEGDLILDNLNDSVTEFSAPHPYTWMMTSTNGSLAKDSWHWIGARTAI